MKNDKGFSMVELLTASVLTAFVAASFYATFFAARNEMVQQNNYFKTNRSARYAVDRIARDVKEAVGVVATQGGYTTGNSTLVLRLPSIDANGEPTNIASQFDYVIYHIDSNDSTKLRRRLDVLNGTSQREGGIDRTNMLAADKVQAVLFTNGGTGLGSIASGTLPTLKYLNVQITARDRTLWMNQNSDIDADLMLRNNIS